MSAVLRAEDGALHSAAEWKSSDMDSWKANRSPDPVKRGRQVIEAFVQYNFGYYRYAPPVEDISQAAAKMCAGESK